MGGFHRSAAFAAAFAMAAALSAPASAMVFDFDGLDIGVLPGGTLTVEEGGFSVRFTGVGLQIRDLADGFVAESGHDRFLSTDDDTQTITVELIGFRAGTATVLNPIFGGVSPEVDVIRGTAFDSGGAVIAGPLDSPEKFFSLSAPLIAMLTYDDAGQSGYVIAEIDLGGVVADDLPPPGAPSPAVPVPAAFPPLLAAFSLIGFIGWSKHRRRSDS